MPDDLTALDAALGDIVGMGWEDAPAGAPAQAVAELATPEPEYPPVPMREEAARPQRGGERRSDSTLYVDPGDRALFDALRAWRAQAAREQNVPAYVIFNDATLVGIAERNPQTLADLQGISGIGAKKLEAYGEEVLRVVRLSA